MTVFGLFVVWILFAIIFQPLDRAVAFSAIDDGLYYPRIAQNICEKGWCTYDGITATNGFHPLWLLSLVPIYGLFHDPWIALKAVYVWAFLLQLVSLGLFAILARRIRMSHSGWMAAAFVLLLNLRSVTVFFSLLESPLVLFLYLFYLVWCIRKGSERFTNPLAAFISGLLLGLCFLARIDSFLLAIAFAVVFVLRKEWTWKVPLLSAVGCMSLVVPYLAWNQAQFGHLETVSAWQKSVSFSPVESLRIVSAWCLHQVIPRIQYVFGLGRIPPSFVLTVMLITLFLGLIYAFTGRRRRRLFDTFSLFPEFPLFVLLHAGFIFLFAPFEAAASAWYWVPEILLAAIVVGVCVRDWRFLRIRFIPVVVILLLIAQALFYPKFLKRKAMTFAKIELAEHLRNNCNEDMRGVMFDSGIVSYFSQRDFISLNGLIGDFEQGELVQDKQYRELAEKYGANLLVLDSPEELRESFEDNIIYETRIKTRFENFQEPPKPFVAYAVTPCEFEEIWRVRYDGKR